MRKESERETCGSKLGDAGSVVQKSGSMSGVRVAKCTELLVIAGEERRTGMNSAADVDQSTIDPMAEFRHRIGFVNIGRRKELETKSAEHFLCGDQETAIVFAPSGNVEEADQNTLGTDANRIIEVSGNSFSNEYSGDISSFDLREDSGGRFGHRRGGR